MRFEIALLLASALAVGACQDDAGPGGTGASGGTATETSATETASVSGSTVGEGSIEGGTAPSSGTASESSSSSSSSESSSASSSSGESDAGSTEVPESTGSESEGAVATCGDGVIQVGEQCDGADLGPFGSCETLGLGTGVVTCDPVVCMLDTQLCTDEGGGTTGI